MADDVEVTAAGKLPPMLATVAQIRGAVKLQAVLKGRVARRKSGAKHGYYVNGAGSKEVNGFYERDGEYGGAPLFKNGQWIGMVQNGSLGSGAAGHQQLLRARLKALGCSLRP